MLWNSLWSSRRFPRKIREQKRNMVVAAGFESPRHLQSLFQSRPRRSVSPHPQPSHSFSAQALSNSIKSVQMKNENRLRNLVEFR